jgi:hypothetical protein
MLPTFDQHPLRQHSSAPTLEGVKKSEEEGSQQHAQPDVATSQIRDVLAKIRKSHTLGSSAEQLRGLAEEALLAVWPRCPSDSLFQNI